MRNFQFVRARERSAEAIDKYSLVYIHAILLVARTPRYVRQGRAVSQRDRGVKTVKNGEFTTPVDRVLIRICASFRKGRRFRSMIGDRHIAEYA